jgi:hypothetical protein
MDDQAVDRTDLRPADHAGQFLIISSHSSVPVGVTVLRRKVAVQDLIDTPLDEALAKLEKRVTENKIALAVQEMERHKGRLALERLFRAEAEWSRYKAEYAAKQLRAREDRLAEKRAAKRARTQFCYL